MNRYPKVALVTMVLGLTAGVVSVADVPRARPDPREVERATHVVMGRVVEVYSVVQTESSGGTPTAVRYVVEFSVEEVVKGDGPQVEQVLFARGSREKLAAGVPDARAPLPRRRARGWLYLIRDRDGGYDLVEPRGFDEFSAVLSD